jgi:DNA-binding Xre family transcriptional regulator
MPTHPARVPAKSAEDLEANNRIRAHLRQQMEERSIDKAELARRVRINDGNLSRQLDDQRGFSVGQVLRICRSLKITPTRLLEEDPPARYFDQLGDDG